MSLLAEVNLASIPFGSPEAAPFPQLLVEKLANRVRPGGLCLMIVQRDGAITYADPAAGPFFAKYVAPLVREDTVLAEKLRRMSAECHVAVFDSLPGFLLAAAPHVERKRIIGSLVLAGRAENFALSESVHRACGRRSIDALWLQSQAQTLPGYSRDALARQALLASSMLADHLRLGGLEQDLNNLSEQLSNTYEELSLIYQISSGMRVNRRSSDFFRQTCQDVLEVMNVAAMGVGLDPNANVHDEPVLYGRISLPAQIQAHLTGQLLSILRQRKSHLLINDVASDKSFAWFAPHARQILAVPLQRHEKVLGCMYVLDKESGDFDSADSKLLNSIANESAIYLENSILFADVHGLMMGLLHSLTSAVDAKDAYTCGHSERVALLSRHLATQVELSDAEVEQIYMAGLLHDVGKIGVPESVLQKTGRLTPEEFEQMKKHPEAGARILADVKQLKSIIPGVLHHHERYDGRGYPSGLAADAIPLMGRIICLADCFDAMTSNRTYRKALPLEVALTEIRRCAGTQFDPRLAEAFLRTGPDALRELLRNHAEKSKKLIDLQATLRGMA